MLPIKDVAASIGVEEDDLELYGKYKAKFSDEYLKKVQSNPNGKLVLVTAINPTPAGEGKTTTTVLVWVKHLVSLAKKPCYCLKRAFSRPLLRH